MRCVEKTRLNPRRMDLVLATATVNTSATRSSLTLGNQQKLNANSQVKLNHHFHCQQQPNVTPSVCKQTNLEETKQIHGQMIKTQFSHNHQIPFEFFQTHSSSAALFNFIITSYIKNHQPKQALKIYHHMRKVDAEIDNFTLPSILKACSQLSYTHQGKELHGYILKTGLDYDVYVQNALIQMYAECTCLESAQKVFNDMPERDVVTWSTMIRSYSRNRCYDKALDIIREMQVLQVKPSEIAMINIANLFANMEKLTMARLVHGYVIKNNGDTYLRSIPLTTALIDMYAKCGSINPARCLFDTLTKKNVVVWTAMIAGYIRCKNLNEGIKLFVQMQQADNVFPNEITMLSLVLECGFTGALEFGKQLHGYMLRSGFKMSLALSTALVDMYGKCGEIKTARSVFDSASEKDVMMWTSIISGYAHTKCMDQAFDLFVQMRNAGEHPNQVTMINLLSLCAETGALDIGKWLHAYIDKQRVVKDIILTTALLDMYAKCGDIERARSIFYRAAYHKDICMWNAMLVGLAMHGHGKEALQLFSELERTEIKPNNVTFIGLLHACSHAGLVTQGKMIFRRMVQEFGVTPQIEHYGCMVDLLGRAGQLDDAHDMIKSMPMKPNSIVWGALLAACKLHKNLTLGKLVAQQLLEIEPHNCGYNVLMSNIYAAANKWNDVAGVRRTMKDTGITKAPGISSMEINGSVHEFIMGDKSHRQMKEILEMVAEMSKKLKQAGHVADTSAVLLNVDEEEKETALAHHSEKLAMAFALISTAPTTPIRIVKNLRVCDDCHSATKLLSKIYARVIIVRDRKRFHHFNEGTCSCKDYW